jgi:hypothetical protein
LGWGMGADTRFPPAPMLATTVNVNYLAKQWWQCVPNMSGRRQAAYGGSTTTVSPVTMRSVATAYRPCSGLQTIVTRWDAAGMSGFFPWLTVGTVGPARQYDIYKPSPHIHKKKLPLCWTN